MSPALSSRVIPDAETAIDVARKGPRDVVLIAGSGIGGMAAALSLAKRGVASHILERRDAFAEEGAGIQIGPNGTRILAELGVAEHLVSHVAVPAGLRVMDGVTGRQLTRMPLGDWIAKRHGAPYWTLHRADLHAALLRSVRDNPLIRMSMGADAVAIENGTSGVTVMCVNGMSISGAALVAADGLRSSIRSATFHSGPLTSSGKSAARTVVPVTAVPDGLSAQDVTIWMHPGAHTVHYPVRGGAEIAIIAIFDDVDVNESWSKPIPSAWVAERSEAFPAPLKALLASASAWKKWALMRPPPIPSWVLGRVALLGDAAHPVMPFLAQGAVLALEDSAVLGREVARDKANLPRALEGYQRKRRSRAKRVADASRANTRPYHASGLTAMARNAVLTTLPPERLIGRYDWLYGWRAD